MLQLYIGKSQEQLTTGDKMQSAGAGGLEALTFGLIDAKTGVEWSNKAAEFFVPGAKKQDLGNINESPIFKYVQQRQQQKAKVQAQFNNAKSELADSLTEQNDNLHSNAKAAITAMINAGDSKDAVDAFMDNLVHKTQDGILELDSPAMASMTRTQRMAMLARIGLWC